jgi:hypothetical protein
MLINTPGVWVSEEWALGGYPIMELVRRGRQV